MEFPGGNDNYLAITGAAHHFLTGAETFHTPSLGDEEFEIPPIALDADPSLAVADFDELGDPPGAPPEAAFAPPYGVQPLDIPVGIGPGLMEQGGGLLPGGLSMELDPPLAAPFAPPPPLPPPGSPGPLLPPALTTIDQSELSSQLGLSLGGGGPALPPPAPDPTPDDRLSATPSPTPSIPEDEPEDFRRPLPPQKPPPAPPPPTPDPSRRPKPPKRPRRRRDPNEPQKPLSAYALFFRDTQAAIKGQNPSATFGEVSKIVASMWDSLGEEQKQVYKRKTEAAKKEYLKALDAYRAIQTTSDPPDQDPTSDPPSQTSSQSLPPPPLPPPPAPPQTPPTTTTASQTPPPNHPPHHHHHHGYQNPHP